jgi:hypothetical protein
MKKTLIIGASTNPGRYAHEAAHRLKQKGNPIVQIGLRKGEVAGEPITLEKIFFEGIDTVTLYVGSRHQVEYYNYLVGLQPKRVIFNPGTENPELEELLKKNGIEAIEACTLVMLSTEQY